MRHLNIQYILLKVVVRIFSFATILFVFGGRFVSTNTIYGAGEIGRILGIHWDPGSDEFAFVVSVLVDRYCTLTWTYKRRRISITNIPLLL